MENILEEIAKKDFEKQRYVDLVISKTDVRDFIIDNMIQHQEIMKYYHCFYIIQDASNSKPKLFYPYWKKFCGLLEHSNSYHRDFGLILIANLVSVDFENRINEIIDNYLELLYDKRIMTAEVCIKNSLKIAYFKPELLDKIIEKLLNFERNKVYSEKQTALMISYIVEGFWLIFEKYQDKNRLIEYSMKHIKSISPKTRKTVKDFLLKFKK